MKRAINVGDVVIATKCENGVPMDDSELVTITMEDGFESEIARNGLTYVRQHGTEYEVYDVKAELLSK